MPRQPFQKAANQSREDQYGQGGNTRTPEEYFIEDIMRNFRNVLAG
jgi:hypothetical protein